jgi:hypothetical protein
MKFRGPATATHWAPQIPRKNPYPQATQTAAWEAFELSNQYYARAAAEYPAHPDYALSLQGTAAGLRVGARQAAQMARDAQRERDRKSRVEKVHKAASAPGARRQRAGV